MATKASPSRIENQAKACELKQRLQLCWDLPLKWDHYPERITRGCKEIGQALDMPPDAILSGILLLVSFFTSHCAITVPGTVWVEPAILWISITMPTGSGKTPLFTFLTNILQKVRSKLNLTRAHPPWLLDEASFEKMGELMATNHSKLLGLYDELSTFLAQINVFRGRGLSDSHDLSAFLSLYTGKSWTRATISGDANFHMERTALTVGGFTQPSVAKALIELPASVEKGLAQRFLWIVPAPSFATFDKLKLVDDDFSDYLVDRLASLWRASEKEILTLTIPAGCKEFRDYYDDLQEKIAQITVLDELLAGMLSKSKGQVLRVAATLHVLFYDATCIDDQEDITVSSVPSTISTKAILAAENFVDTCCQHAAFIAGRSKMADEITRLTSGSVTSSTSLATFCLLLPGKRLHLSALLFERKFRGRGNKTAALEALHQLEVAGLGKLEKEKSHRGTAATYTFTKEAVDNEKLEELAEKLAQFGVTISQYQRTLHQEEIVAKPSAGCKRPRDSTPPAALRRSPRKLDPTDTGPQ